MAIQQLEALHAGKTQNLDTALEFDVDEGLIRGYDLFNNPLRPLFSPLWGFDAYPSYEQYAVQLANYRKEHPSPHTTEFLKYFPRESAEEKADYAELAEGARLYEFKLNAMVKRYATTP